MVYAGPMEVAQPVSDQRLATAAVYRITVVQEMITATILFAFSTGAPVITLPSTHLSQQMAVVVQKAMV